MSLRPPGGQAETSVPFWAVALMGLIQSTAANALGVGVPLAIVWLGGAPFVLGLAFTAWAAGRSVMGFVAGQHFDAGGARATLVLSFLVTAAVAALYAVVRAPDLFILMRLCQGLGAGLYWTAILSLAGHSAAPPLRLRRLAGFNNAVAIGGILGSLLGGWAIAPLGGSAPMWGAMVLNLALAGLALLLVPVRRRVQAPPRPAPFGLQGAAVGASLTAAAAQLPNLLTNAGLPLLLVHRGLGGGALGIENALMVGGALLGQSLYTRYAAWGSTRAGTLAVYVVGVAALVAVGSGTEVWLLLGLAALGSVVRLLAVVWVSTVQSIAEPSQVGRATGLTRSSSDILSALTYPLVGLAEESLAATVAAMALVFAASGALLVTAPTRRWFGTETAAPERLAETGG